MLIVLLMKAKLSAGDVETAIARRGGRWQLTVARLAAEDYCSEPGPATWHPTSSTGRPSQVPTSIAPPRAMTRDGG
jgi:hypothetical protein